jgi:hypothetical protein
VHWHTRAHLCVCDVGGVFLWDGCRMFTHMTSVPGWFPRVLLGRIPHTTCITLDWCGASVTTSVLNPFLFRLECRSAIPDAYIRSVSAVKLSMLKLVRLVGKLYITDFTDISCIHPPCIKRTGWIMRRKKIILHPRPPLPPRGYACSSTE